MGRIPQDTTRASRGERSVVVVVVVVVVGVVVMMVVMLNEGGHSYRL